MCFFRASAVADAGGFDEYYAYYLDESDLCMRIIQRGYTCRYGEDIAVIHEAAPGPNRKDAYHEDMFVIARSQAYFILKATGNTGKSREEREARARQSLKPKADHIKLWTEKQLISQGECNELIEAIRKGAEQGIRDSENERKLDFSIKSKPKRFKKYDKTISEGHRSFCLFCDVTKEEMPEHARLLMKDLSGKGHHVFVIITGERTKLELIDGVNYCTVNVGRLKGQWTIPLRETDEALSVLQELQEPFDIQTIITPVQDMFSSVSCRFSAEQLFITGDGVKTEGIIRLMKTGIQYGPYIVLAKGKYEVQYTGNNLHLIDQYYVTTDFGKQIIPCDLIEVSDRVVRYSFTIDERTDKIEFAAKNQQKEPVEIMRIDLRKAGYQ